MAARKPLVLVGGRTKELPSGDTLAGVGGSGGIVGLRVISGTTDTPTNTDKDKLLRCQNSGTTTLTITAGSFAADDMVHVSAEGAGGVVLSPGSGQTFIPAGAQTLPAGRVATLVFLGSDTWLVAGGLSPGNAAVNLGMTVLGSDVTNSNSTGNTIADVTGLSFPAVSGKRYRFRFFVRYTSAATTTGSRWSINGPSTSELTYRSQYSLTATTQTVNEGLTAYNVPAASNANSAATAGNIAIIEGIILPSASGNVIARFASEVGGSTITAKAGSYVEWQALS